MQVISFLESYTCDKSYPMLDTVYSPSAMHCHNHRNDTTYSSLAHGHATALDRVDAMSENPLSRHAQVD